MAIYMWRELGPLCFTANTAGSTVQLTKVGSPYSFSLETSTDLQTWSDYTIGNTITLTNIGDKIYLRNKSTGTTTFSKSNYDYYKFVMTGSIAGSGDVTSLLNKNYTTTILSTNSYCFYNLFYSCASLTTPPELLATNITAYCYQHMFDNCTSLVKAPSVLPATTLAESCYSDMFYNCPSLTTTPSLPATTLAEWCYYEMFYSCTSLNTLPKLPATTLANYCYRSMFQYCSNIKLSTTQTGDYQTAYRIPTTGTGSEGTNSLYNMFSSTGGSWSGRPDINTTYYTSNTVV